MDKKDIFEEVLVLRENGLNYCEISRQTGINRRTIMDWCAGKVDKNKLKTKHSRHRSTDLEFINAVKESYSIAEVLRRLELVRFGGNYKSFHSRVKRLSLDTSHFTGQGHLKGKINKYVPELSIEDSFIYDGDLSTTNLKRKILKHQLIEYKCNECQLTEWRGVKLSLHLDHIDGDNRNNLLSNLRFLCPNCHSLTPTYCGKNKSISF